MSARRAFLALFVASCSLAASEDVVGIWMGQAPGKNAEKQDVAFQFKNVNGRLSGVMFGDEFDLPLENLTIEGNAIHFSVTATNYYSGNRLTTDYSGTVSATELQLTRQRKDSTTKAEGDDKSNEKQTITLQRVTGPSGPSNRK